MASTSEVGHAKQLAEFEDFTRLLILLGTTYSPPKPAMGISNLTAQIALAKSAMRDISSNTPRYSNAVDQQTLAFKDLNDKVTRSLNFYKVCLNNPAEIDTAKNLADKIRGVSKTKKVAAEATAGKTVSQSQMSYDSRIENFKQYIDVLTISGVYLSPGNGIELSDLTAYLQDMEQTNLLVAEMKAPLDVARKNRDVIFYAPNTGLADLGISIKQYLKATLAKDHPHYKALMGFAFKNKE